MIQTFNSPPSTTINSAQNTTINSLQTGTIYTSQPATSQLSLQSNIGSTLIIQSRNGHLPMNSIETNERQTLAIADNSNFQETLQMIPIHQPPMFLSPVVYTFPQTPIFPVSFNSNLSFIIPILDENQAMTLSQK